MRGAIGAAVFNHIVLLTDLTEVTRLAFKPLAVTAQTLGSRITIFHAFRGSSELFYLGGEAARIRQVIDDADRARAMPTLLQYQRELAALGVEAEIDARVGSTFELGVDVLGELQADLAVVATEGQHEFTGRVLGSPTARLIRDARVPVMSVNERFASRMDNWHGFERVVHPIDFADEWQELLIAAEDFAAEIGGKLELVDVVQPAQAQTLVTPEGDILLPKDMQYQIRSRLQARLSNAAHQVTRVPAFWQLLEDNKPGSAIMSYVDKVGADAIVVPAIGRDNVRNTVLGSMAEHVIKHARCPVLTTRPEWTARQG